jgi:predicted Zn-dependent protease
VDRARTLIASGNAEAAVADLELAKKNDPQEPTIHFYLATAYRSQGRAADAHNEMQTYKHLLESASDAESKRAAEAESMKNNSH